MMQQIPTWLSGRSFNCPSCSEPVTCGEETAYAPDAQDAEAFVFRCPSCGKLIRVSKKSAPKSEEAPPTADSGKKNILEEIYGRSDK